MKAELIYRIHLYFVNYSNNIDRNSQSIFNAELLHVYLLNHMHKAKFTIHMYNNFLNLSLC